MAIIRNIFYSFFLILFIIVIIGPQIIHLKYLCVAIIILTFILQKYFINLNQLYLNFRMVKYVSWLFQEIYNSSISITKLIWSSKQTISPTTTSIKLENYNNLEKVILANSITLTPGTITLNIDQDLLVFNSLKKEDAQDLIDGNFKKQILKVKL